MLNNRLWINLFPLLLTALVLPSTTLANAAFNQLTPAEWEAAEKKFKTWCNNQKAPDAIIFGDSAEKGQKIMDDVCAGEIKNQKELGDQISELLVDLHRLFPESGLAERIYFAETAQFRKSGELSQILIEDQPKLAIELASIEYEFIQDEKLSECEEAVDRLSSGSSCKGALKEFADVYNFSLGALSQPIALAFSVKLEQLEHQWNDYFDNSKSQTLWEMALNRRLFQSSREGLGYTAPPEWQLVVMHPTLVIENVSDALDGEQMKESIMIEAIGADWWQQDKWYLPSGGAIIASYTDRAGVDDWGYGISLNFKSKYTLGFSDHGGELGTFITGDFLKLLQDKSDTIKSYREPIKF